MLSLFHLILKVLLRKVSSSHLFIIYTDFDETVCYKIKELEDELNQKVFCPCYDYQNKLLKENS